MSPHNRKLAAMPRPPIIAVPMPLLGLLALLAFLSLPAAAAETLALAPQTVTDWKAVFGRVEARDRIPARARIGGTLIELTVTEGESVTAGQPIGRIRDDKLEFQLGAIEAQLDALRAQLANAEADLARGEELLSRGVTTVQRLDAQRTQVDVLRNQIAAQSAEKQVVEQQVAEGTVLAPIAGRVLAVPQAAGAVIQPGEPVAVIGGGGFFLRLAVPERHAASLAEGDAIGIVTEAGISEGRLAKLYPVIENGRVIADVEVAALDAAFVDARVLVRLPVGQHEALLVPVTAVQSRFGLDFVAIEENGSRIERTVVLGDEFRIDGIGMVEVLTGLFAGDRVVTTHE